MLGREKMVVRVFDGWISVGRSGFGNGVVYGF